MATNPPPMTDKRLRAASQSSSKPKAPPSNLPLMMFNVLFGKVVRCPSCLIGIAVPQPQNRVQAQTPSDTAETHQFGAETAELPVQEEKRVTIAFAVPNVNYRPKQTHHTGPRRCYSSTLPAVKRRLQANEKRAKVTFGKVVRCPSCLIGIVVPQPQNRVQESIAQQIEQILELENLEEWAGSAIPTVVSTTASTPVSYMRTAAPAATQSVVSRKCNWTEHTSPDGFKYYYNGQTGESKWEKPEEMVLFERQQQQPTINQPQTQSQQALYSQPMQQQPQQVHQQYQGQYVQQPIYSSVYPTPGVSQNAQYPPPLGVSQNSQAPVKMLRDTKGPPPRPLLLFTALSNLRRASSIQSRAHPTDHTADHFERRAKPHTQNTTRTRTDPTNRSKLRRAKQDCESLHLPETRTDYGEAEEASTSRRQEPAAAKLWKPPPPGNRTQTTIIFTAPTLQATASSLQEQNHRERCLARGQTRRLLKETRRRELRTN
ncbi:hypothetical protein F2Q70_00035372 [Brassica cretica]|uniref:WW domain-containing protein n=1 Tax=Brassica cretica TaxID=69181 RepID=A0A8S9JR01_BRACR|nr:hypothetical protein F2Q70_00035372 [Brassica cretica]